MNANTISLACSALLMTCGVGLLSYGIYDSSIQALSEKDAKIEALERQLQEVEYEAMKYRLTIDDFKSKFPVSVSLKGFTGKATRGIRNRNPANIVAMSSKSPWLGQIGKDEKNHAVFETYEHGLRALYLTLKGYKTKYGINTLIALTTKYCEGDTTAYAHYLAKQLGVARIDQPIDIMQYMPKLMKAIVRMECGYDIYPDTAYIAYNR